MMKARNDTLQRFNAITGLNVVCQFSKSWEREELEAEQTVYQMQSQEQSLLTDNSGSEEPADEPEDSPEETAPNEVHEGALETEEQTVAEEIAEQAEEGLTIEAQANTLPIDEETGRREIEEDADNDTDSIPDESSASDPS
jgi:hypothetical protein